MNSADDPMAGEGMRIYDRSGSAPVPEPLLANIRLVAGSPGVEASPLPFFADEVLAFIGELAARLLTGSHARAFPDLASLGFWGRKKNLQRLRARYPEARERLGRGLCFHMAPGNIPINFAFSLLFSLLAGNANIVRLPGREFPQNIVLCRLLNELLPEFPEIARRTALLRYPRDTEINAWFSGRADVRMVWGGDGTAAMMKALPTKPRCVDIFFADRSSVALINAQAIASATDAEMDRLAENFYNDTWLMDQNACSSPQIIFWENASPPAIEKFWHKMEEVAAARYALQPASGVDKLVNACMESIDEPAMETCIHTTNLLYRLELAGVLPDISAMRGSCGYFHEYALTDRRALFPLLGEKIQTITWYGIDPERLRRELIENLVKGVDRIVPVGRAMEIGLLWDGHDLPRELSRVLALE